MTKENTHKIIRKAGKFILAVLIFDLVIGMISSKLFFDQKSGKFYRLTKTIYSDTSAVLIMGSSHATRHYVPEVFESSLNLSCFNSGVQGQKILFVQALEEMVLQRYSPNIIILNVDEDWLFEDEQAYDRMSDLHPYYWDFRDVIKPKLSLRSRFVDMKLSFKSYQNNSTIVHIFKYMLSPQKDFEGYKPFFDSLRPSNGMSDLSRFKKKIVDKPIDSNFVQAYEQFIDLTKTKNIKLYTVVSPTLMGTVESENASLKLLHSIAKEKGVPYLDYSNDEEFLYQTGLYHDPDHMNDRGARIFSKKLCDSIEVLLEK